MDNRLPLRSCLGLKNLLLSLVLTLCVGAVLIGGQQATEGIEEQLIMSLRFYSPQNQSTWAIRTLGPKSKMSVSLAEIPSDIRFYVFQAHSYSSDISLSYNNTLSPHYYINGTNLGLVSTSKTGQGTFFVLNPNVENVTVMFAVVAYGAYSPIPGGCNMEFEVETAPYLKVRYSDAMIDVSAQPAQIPGSSCTRDLVTHDMYHMFMSERDFTEESYFAAIRAMLTPYDILTNGSLTSVPVYGSTMRRLYSLYAGTGSVYVVLAKSSSGVSAYVPAISYGCSAVYFTDSCTILSTVFSKVLCACVLFLGIFTCFYGHEFFKVQLFLAGFLSGSFLSYVALSQGTALPFGSGVTLASVTGVGFGMACLLLWCFYGIPIVAILTLVAPLGYLAASLVFYCGLGDLQFAQLDLDFWLTFTLLGLGLILLLLPLQHRASMISCAVVGAYVAAMPVDHYVGSNLKYIVINTLRRATVPGFSLAVIDPPFQVADGLVALLWVLLAMMGYRVQQIRTSGRPPFPPASRPAQSSPSAAATARTPLRVSSRIPHGYGSVGDDDVFETPPAPGSAPNQSPSGSLAGWFGRNFGLRGR